MKIVFLTTNDPIYLPAFFDYVLERNKDQTVGIYSVPPLYKEQTVPQAIWRYYKTFGLMAVLGLSYRVLMAKINRQSIEAICHKHGVTFDRIQDVNAPDFLEQLRHVEASLIVSVSCPQLFRKPLIQLADQGCLNIHGAILPNYRGIMPSFWMLANGEKQAGVSIFFVNERIDAGDLCGQRIFDIHANDSLDRFLRRSKQFAAELLCDVLSQIESGTVDRVPLNLQNSSYYTWPDTAAVKRFRATGRKLW